MKIFDTLEDLGGFAPSIPLHIGNTPVRMMAMKDTRAELDKLIAAFERHFEVASSITDEDEQSPVLTDAEEQLRDAFFTYDDALFTATGVELPFDILDDEDAYDEDDDEDEEDDEDIEDLDEDDLHHVGLDDDNDYLDEDDLEGFDLDD